MNDPFQQLAQILFWEPANALFNKLLALYAKLPRPVRMAIEAVGNRITDRMIRIGWAIIITAYLAMCATILILFALKSIGWWI